MFLKSIKATYMLNWCVDKAMKTSKTICVFPCLPARRRPKSLFAPSGEYKAMCGVLTVTSIQRSSFTEYPKNYRCNRMCASAFLLLLQNPDLNAPCSFERWQF
jgi:hypothetical protein